MAAKIAVERPIPLTPTITTTSSSGADLVAPPPQGDARKPRRPRRRQRIGTAYRSFRTLKGLTPQQVDNFMNSYVIYSLDWADENQMRETLGPDYQQRVGECLQDWYSVLNHMCSIGEVEKMYIPPCLDPKASVIMNQILWEENVARVLNLQTGKKVLDLGCGRGRVAAHISSITGAQVTGINIDSDQIQNAIAFTKEEKLPNQFVRADFNDLPLPFADNEFDGVYEVGASSLIKDLPLFCKELHRVLKPGARVSFLDWASLDAYDPENPHHQKLMARIKPLIGAVGTPTPKSMADALRAGGFDIVEMNNASIDGLQAPMVENADKYFRSAKFTILGLVRVGLLPAHFRTLFERMTKDCEAYLEADRARLVTMSYHWLAEKRMEEVAKAKTEDSLAEAKVQRQATLPEGLR